MQRRLKMQFGCKPLWKKNKLGHYSYHENLKFTPTTVIKLSTELNNKCFNLIG